MYNILRRSYNLPQAHSKQGLRSQTYIYSPAANRLIRVRSYAPVTCCAYLLRRHIICTAPRWDPQDLGVLPAAASHVPRAPALAHPPRHHRVARREAAAHGNGLPIHIRPQIAREEERRLCRFPVVARCRWCSLESVNDRRSASSSSSSSSSVVVADAHKQHWPLQFLPAPRSA